MRKGVVTFSIVVRKIQVRIQVPNLTVSGSTEECVDNVGTNIWINVGNLEICGTHPPNAPRSVVANNLL